MVNCIKCGKLFTEDSGTDPLNPMCFECQLKNVFYIDRTCPEDPNYTYCPHCGKKLPKKG